MATTEGSVSSSEDLTNQASDKTAPVVKKATRKAAKKGAQKAAAKKAAARKSVAKKSVAKKTAEVAEAPIATQTVAKKATKRTAKKATKATTKRVMRSSAAGALAPSQNNDLVSATEAIAERERELERLRMEHKRIEEDDIQRRLAIVKAELPVIVGMISQADRKALISELSKGAPKVPRANAKKGVAKKARKTGKVPPKYRLESGKTWTGRGRMPLEFVAFRQKNPSKDFPPA